MSTFAISMLGAALVLLSSFGSALIAYVGYRRVRDPAGAYAAIQRRAARHGLRTDAVVADPQRFQQTLRKQGYAFLILGLLGVVFAVALAVGLLMFGGWVADFEREFTATP